MKVESAAPPSLAKVIIRPDGTREEYYTAEELKKKKNLAEKLLDLKNDSYVQLGTSTMVSTNWLAAQKPADLSSFVKTHIHTNNVPDSVIDHTVHKLLDISKNTHVQNILISTGVGLSLYGILNALTEWATSTKVILSVLAAILTLILLYTLSDKKEPSPASAEKTKTGQFLDINNSLPYTLT